LSYSWVSLCFTQATRYVYLYPGQPTFIREDIE
jgi:hypothetical protein